MAADVFTEVTSQNIFQRLGKSLAGVVVGLVLLVVAFPMLWWNEGRAVYREQTLKAGRGQVVSIQPDAPDPNREGSLVHLSGLADTQDTVRDPVFGVAAQAIRLNREVEMFQWNETTRTETRKKVGGGQETITHYEYEKTWSTSPISSSRFRRPEGHQNPAMPYQSHAEFARNVVLGEFRLRPDQIRRMTASEPLPISERILRLLPSDLRQRATLQGSGLYIGADPSVPRVGDLRIRFTSVQPAVVSLIAKQVGQSFEPFQLERGVIDEFRYGALTADQMFTAAEKENTILTWILRFAGFLLMAIGLGTMFAPLAVLGDVIPFIGSILRFGIGIFSSVIAFALSLTTIALAWITYRPLLGVGLLAVAIGSVVLMRMLAGGKEPPAQTSPSSMAPPGHAPRPAAPPPPPPPPPH